MTATRIGRGATLAGAAAAWIVAALFLWRTTVPANLHLPHLDESAVFGAALVRHAQRYERFLDVIWIFATIATLAAYVVVLPRARALAPRLRLGNVNAGIVLGVLAFTAVAVATLPFDLAATWWQRRHGISRESYAAAVFAQWGQLLGIVFVGTIVLAIVLGLARRLPRRWWIAAVPVLALMLLALQFVVPYLATLGAQPLQSAELRADVRTLEQREHAGRPTVRVEDVSGRTTAANAFSVGIGPTERVVLWNTLLDGRFDHDQVRFVIGHELGHVARNHILRGIAWFALLLTAVLFVVSRAVDVRNPAAVPAALLLIVVSQLALLPFRNALSRRYEAEADWIGLNGTRDPAAARGLFKGFVATSLQDPSPPGWVHVFLDDHPSALARIEAARAWATRNR